jgi:hypothetical protein
LNLRHCTRDHGRQCNQCGKSESNGPIGFKGMPRFVVTELNSVFVGCCSNVTQRLSYVKRWTSSCIAVLTHAAAEHVSISDQIICLKSDGMAFKLPNVALVAISWEAGRFLQIFVSMSSCEYI